MKLYSFLLLPLLLVGGFLYLTPESKSVESELNSSSPMLQSTAKDNFLKYCAGCHGTNMERFAGNTWEAFKSGGDLTPVIKNGLPVLGMPSFEKAFTDAEMKAISDYILEMKDKKEAPVAVKFPPIVRSKHQSFRIDTIAKGLDVPWGMAFFA